MSDQSQAASTESPAPTNSRKAVILQTCEKVSQEGVESLIKTVIWNSCSQPGWLEAIS